MTSLVSSQINFIRCILMYAPILNHLIHQLNICQKIAQISTSSGHFDDYTVSKCCGCCLTFLKHKIEIFIKKGPKFFDRRNYSSGEIIRRAKLFVGRNFRRAKLFVGRNFRHLAKNSSLSPDKVSPDKVYGERKSVGYSKVCSGVVDSRRSVMAQRFNVGL